MECFNGELTTSKITVNGDIIFTGTIQGDGSGLTGSSWNGGTVSNAVTFENTIYINTPAVSGTEILTTYRVSDAPLDDKLEIINTTTSNGLFVPSIRTQQNPASTAGSLFLIQAVPDAVTTNGALVIDSRTPTNTVLTNRPLVVIRNFTTPVLTVEANSNLRLNGGALVFPDTAKSISGGAGSVMNINAGVNSMIFRNTAAQFMRGNSGGVGIEITASDAAINTSAILTLTSTSKGFLPPRMTTSERNAIASPATGLTVYNTTTNVLNWYNGSSWTAPSTPTVGSYTISVQALTSNPVDAQTIYFGQLPKAPVTTANISKVYIRKSGTIKAVNIYCYAGTAGTSENWTCNIRLNNTTDTLVETIGAATNERVFNNESLNIPVVAGEYFEIKMTNPTWATNPATAIFGGYVYIEY
jgi:hypothetical protein